MTWQQEAVTGITMIKTTIICNKKNPKLILGALCIGNYGFDHNHLRITLLRTNNLREIQNPGFLCPRVIVGNIMEANNVSGVLSNIHVHCVQSHPIVNCINFRPSKGKPVSATPPAANTGKSKQA